MVFLSAEGRMDLTSSVKILSDFAAGGEYDPRYRLFGDTNVGEWLR